MIHFNQEEMLTVAHAAEVMGDRIHNEPDEYTAADRSAVDGLDKMGKPGGGALVLTGAAMSSMAESQFLKQIVEAELDAWVPNASQRLLYRAARALNHSGSPRFLTSAPDCGSTPQFHALIPDWIEGIYVLRCATCGRMYRR